MCPGIGHPGPTWGCLGLGGWFLQVQGGGVTLPRDGDSPVPGGVTHGAGPAPAQAALALLHALQLLLVPVAAPGHHLQTLEQHLLFLLQLLQLLQLHVRQRTRVNGTHARTHAHTHTAHAPQLGRAPTQASRASTALPAHAPVRESYACPCWEAPPRLSPCGRAVLSRPLHAGFPHRNAGDTPELSSFLWRKWRARSGGAGLSFGKGQPREAGWCRGSSGGAVPTAWCTEAAFSLKDFFVWSRATSQVYSNPDTGTDVCN